LLRGRKRTAAIPRTVDQERSDRPPDRLGLEQSPTVRAGSDRKWAGLPWLRTRTVGPPPKLPSRPVAPSHRSLAGLQHALAPRCRVHVRGRATCDLPGWGRKRDYSGRAVHRLRRSPGASLAQDAGPVGKRRDMRLKVHLVTELTADEQS